MKLLLTRVYSHISIIFLLIIFVVVSVFLITQESLTFDERVNIQEGLNNVVRKSFDIEPYNPPLIRELAVFPLVAMGIHHGDNLPPPEQIFWSRMVILFLGVLLIATTYGITLSISNKRSALFASLLLFLDPQIIAHSHYITPDIGSTFFLLLAWWMFITLNNKPTIPNMIVIGLTAGLLAVSKIPAFLFFVLFVGCYLFLVHKQALLKRIFFHYKKILIGLFVMLTTIWSSYGFGFSPIIKPSANDQRVSTKIIQWADTSNLPFIKESVLAFTMPLPLGEFMGILKNTILRGGQDRTDFFLGNFVQGRWYFLPIMFVLKTPFPLLIIWIGALGIALTEVIKNPSQKEVSTTMITKRHIKKSLILLLIIIISGTFIINTAPLVRYLLVILPFLAILSGLLLGELWFTKMGKVTILLLYVGLLRAAFSWFPHPLTYANYGITYFSQPKSQKNNPVHIDKHNVALIQSLHDSNLDWGQGLISLSTYVGEKQPQRVLLSYFGRDEASQYGFPSLLPWGSHKADEICAFHPINYSEFTGPPLVIISVTNWHGCKYSSLPEYGIDKLIDVVNSMYVVFPSL